MIISIAQLVTLTVVVFMLSLHFQLSTVLVVSLSLSMSSSSSSTCQSYCGNITVDYPFGLRSGCGHSGFRDLLFCINGVLMFHIPSGSYRVLRIDYAYPSLTLHDPSMSDCYSIVSSSSSSSSHKGNGFVLEPWRVPYLAPAPDNVFFLLGCRAESPLFQGFPAAGGEHLPCRNVSGMGCDDYYRCPAWLGMGGSSFSSSSSSSSSVNPPECCSLSYGWIRGINLTHLGCQGYSSAYSLAPVRAKGPGEWSYGIRVSYSVPPDHEGACRACQDTGGVCGYDAIAGGGGDLCICAAGRWNSTSNCDSVSDTVSSLASTINNISSLAIAIRGLLLYMLARASAF